MTTGITGVCVDKRRLDIAIDWAGKTCALFWLFSDAELAARALSAGGDKYIIRWKVDGFSQSLAFVNGEVVE